MLPTIHSCPVNPVVSSIEGVSQGDRIRNDCHSCSGVLDLAAQAVGGTLAPGPFDVKQLGYVT